MRLGPLYGFLDAVFELGGGVVVEESAGFANVGDVVRDFADARGFDGEVRRNAEAFGDVVGHFDQGLSLPEGEVDGVVFVFARNEELDPAGDPADAVIDVGEIEHFLSTENRNGLSLFDALNKEWDDAFHPFDIVVVASVYVAEPENEVGEVITLGVGIYEGFTGDF
mgnify:CR=1 FL=1